MRCLFTSDLHGRVARYEKLFALLAERPPDALFLGGDLLPGGVKTPGTVVAGCNDFVLDFLVPRCERLRRTLGDRYPAIYLILGNDDPRLEEAAFLRGDEAGLWHYAHERRLPLGRFDVYGYAHVPPTPFLWKDWERYDVSRYVDPGCVSPEEGFRSVPVDPDVVRWSTIERDLRSLAGVDDLSAAIFLFHSPPHGTDLDRAALDDVRVDHVPVDVHVGSIAIRRFLEERGPRISLHGHVHEATRLTGAWRARVGRTHAFGGAHDGPELPLVSFDPEEPEAATRELR